MKLSFSTKGWHNHTFDEFCDMAASLGYAGVEIHNIHGPMFTDRDGAFYDYAAAATLRRLFEKKLTIPCIDCLTDPSDALNCGIEIIAQPPGKKLQLLSLLSGGEKALAAIALLFAILKVTPSPFCVLDEIEAALDEVNVTRFAEKIKRYASGTQFILITHRRGTMEIGDRLYGITMPQRGISQAIELNVDEIEGKQKELLDGVL